MGIRPAAYISFFFLLISVYADAKDPEQVASPFKLDVDAISGSPIALKRPEDGLIRLNIIYAGTEASNAEVETTSFSSETGSIAVDILADCGNPASKQPELEIPVEPNAVVPVCLFVHPLPTAGKYTGRLIISAPGVAPLVKTVTVERPVSEQGTLVLDHTTISQTVSPGITEPFSKEEQVLGSVVLREKTTRIPLEGVSVRLEQISTSPDSGFDLEKNVKFQLNGKDADLYRDPPENGDVRSRAIPEGGQAVVTMTMHDLKPGDYVATLRFAAHNSASDDAQKLQINVHVRDSLWFAIVLMIIALILSFIATKWLTLKRRQASLLKQIHTLRPQWLSSLLPSPAVVWVKAVLHQAERLSRRFWLTSPDVIETNVNSVRSMLGVLDTIHLLRVQLESALDRLVFRRAAIGLDGVVTRLGTSTLTDSAIQSLNKDLDGFKDWLDDTKFAAVFWEKVKPNIQSLLNQAKEEEVSDSAIRQQITTLKQSLAGALNAAPTNRGAVEDIYHSYIKMRIIWDNRGEAKLRELISANADIMEFLKVADDRIWSSMKNCEGLSIRLPTANGADGLEAYEILQFSVETNDPEIASSYLFRQKVDYEWIFELEPKKHWWKKNPSTIRLQPRSVGPLIVQYFPRPGRIRVSAKPVYDGQQAEKTVSTDQELSIKESSDFRGFKILAGTEILSWIIAAIVAIPTGLTMFYYKGTSWGTYQDYLTLFLWGVGVDQGKNFLQALQTYSAQAANPPPTTHA